MCSAVVADVVPASSGAFDACPYSRVVEFVGCRCRSLRSTAVKLQEISAFFF